MLLFSLITNAQTNWSHAFYLSVIEMELEGDLGNIRIKVFEDDLENALMNKFPDQFRFGLDIKETEFQAFVDHYFNEEIVLKIDHLERKLYNGRLEKEGDSIWIQYDFKYEASFNILSLKAIYFSELFKSQINVLNFKYQNKQLFKKLSLKDAIFVFES